MRCIRRYSSISGASIVLFQIRIEDVGTLEIDIGTQTQQYLSGKISFIIAQNRIQKLNMEYWIVREKAES